MKDPMKVGKPGVNYYALLGVPSTATQEEITKAFRKKILQVHLDKMGPEDDTELCYLTIEAHRILSDKALRQKYDVERSSSKDYKAQDEKFVPAGYICYDVGHQQMSRQLLDSITSWTSEYEKCPGELSDNYFNCFSQIMSQVMDDDKNDNALRDGSAGKLQPSQLDQNFHQQKSYYYCPVCDKRYVTETHHWDTMINPYRMMFFSDQQGIAALNAYFQSLIGQNMFEWEMRYLPARLLGIWGSSEWSMVPKLHQQTINILKHCDFYNESSSSESESDTVASSSTSVVSQLESMLDCSTSKGSNASFTSAQNAFLRRSLIQNLMWVLENRDQSVEQMMSRMNELIMQDDIQEIMCLGMAMRNVLKFQSSEWEQLIQDALSTDQFELAMLWTMLAVESGDKSRGDWFQLGMTIRGMEDAVLAHFCFLLAGCESPNAWEELADIFTQNGAHYAAIEYHLNRGNLFQLLNKSRALKKVDAESAAIYSGIFYATRIKGLLQVLRKRSRQCFSDNTSNEKYNAEIEELIEIMQELGGNLLEGFRIIVSTWPDVFEEAPGYWIHRATIQYLRKGNVNLKSQKLIVAAVHFLPEDEAFEELCQVTKEASQLTKAMLERAHETNDFEMLTDVLMHLSKRTLTAAEDYLEEIRPRPPTPPTEKTQNDKDDGESQQEEAVPPLAPAPEPSHKSALYLLLSGTVHKVNEAWLDAMKDYQNALLSAPEVMHRVLPCVSKLVQDIQFHEAVVAQVQREIQDLQVSLSKKEYPNVDEFTSDKRRSLILTDVAPIMDYGYKDSVSKIQSDPNQMPPPPPPDEEPMDAPPPPPANTPMVTLDRNQEAINSGQLDGQMDQLSAALAYVDLLKALPLPMHPGPIVMAASHFLRAMDENATSEEIGKLYAYRNAIMLMAENLLRVDKKLQHTIHHGLTHKHMLSILLSAHEKLSKALAKKNDNNGDAKESGDESPTTASLPTPSPSDEPVNNKAKSNHESEENNNCDRKPVKKDLIRKSEAHVISKLFQNVVNFPKVEPLASIPTLNCSDLVYVETLGNSFLSQFCADKVRQKHQSPLIPKHLHAYTHFVEVWKGRSTLSDFPQARVKAMEELLALKGWTMADVQRKMMWPFLTMQQDGFSPPVECLLQLRDPFRSYRTIDGFQINYETGSVELLMSRDPMNPVDTLFDMHDILDVVSLSKAGLDRLVFSLETPSDGGGFCSHPFKEARFSFAGTKTSSQQHQKIVSQIPEFVMATLSRVSLLLCYLASGLEMCSEAPFWMRRTDEGLLARLDEHLQYLARPVLWRKAERRENHEKSAFETETVGKFWLNIVEVFEEIEEEEKQDDNSDDPLSIIPSSQLTYRVGQMRTEIRPNTLVMTLDPKRGKQRLSPEAEFCKDLTRHFQEFSRAFSEFQRLEELVKMSVVCSKLKQVLMENKALIQEFHGKNNNPSSSADSPCNGNNCKLKAVHRVCSIIESFLTLQNPAQEKNRDNGESTCNWFPATFCHNMDPDVYDVTAGLELDPVVTYGPVPAPPKPIKVPLAKLIELSGSSVVGLGVDDDSSTTCVKDIEVAENNSISETCNIAVATVIQVETNHGNTNEEECSAGDDTLEDETCINERHLSAVPEESEEDEESNSEECTDADADAMSGEEDENESSFAGSDDVDDKSEYDEQNQSVVAEDLVSDEEIDDAVAVTDDNEDSPSDKGSQCEELDTDESSFEENAVASDDDDEEGQVLENDPNSDVELKEESVFEVVDNGEDEVNEKEVPTLTIMLKRSSIISQPEEDSTEESEEDLESSDSEKIERGIECNDIEKRGSAAASTIEEDELDEDNQESISDEVSVTDEDYLEEESIENDNVIVMDDDIDDMKQGENEAPSCIRNEKLTNSFLHESEVSSEEEYESEENEDQEEENLESETEESENVADNSSNVNGENKETCMENGKNDKAALVENCGNDSDASSSPISNKSLLTDEKCVLKLRKVLIDDPSSKSSKNQTKRSFLTRRGKLVNTEKVMENMTSDSHEKKSDSEDDELITGKNSPHHS